MEFGQWPAWMPDGRRVLFVSCRKAFYLAGNEAPALVRMRW